MTLFFGSWWCYLSVAVTTSKTEVEVIVFVAIMLHKVWGFFLLADGSALFNSSVSHNAYAFTAYLDTIFLILNPNSSFFPGSSDTLHCNWLSFVRLDEKYMYLAWDFEAQTESSKVPA